MGKKILIVLNAVVYNRGSEALVRGLSQLCKEANKDNKVYLSSSEMELQEKVKLPNIDGYINRYKSKGSFIDKVFLKATKLLHIPTLYYSVKCKELLNFSKDMDVVIIVGADNYDKSYNMFTMLHSLNLLFKKNSNGKLLLYDCSLEKGHIDANVINDIKLFDAVTARESITIENFKEIISEDKLYYFPDPAFIMEPEKIDLPVGFEENNMVGINLSNLVTRDDYGSNKDIIMNSYYKLINHILDDTNMNIVLVPHVMKGADLSVLKIIYNKYKETGRIILIENEDYNAAQLKYIISKCRLYVGARTHSTIAAYSSKIPTLVLGYSVKSIGIAKDLFGSEKNYVISVSSLKSEEDLVNGFKWIEEKEDSIRKHLSDFMPKYIDKVKNTVNLINKL